jgi:methionyl-tRNA synthetase
MSRAFYVTTPIYYVNAEPHIGHTYTTVLADALARYHRLAGEKTFFLTGTDEHGEKIAEVAEQRGVTPKEVADQYSTAFRGTWEELGFSHDRFIRTTDPDHVRTVQAILSALNDAGEIYFKEYQGLYCVGCERFLTGRDMENDLCKDHERKPEERTESNYFFRMSRHFAWLEQHIRDYDDFIRPQRYRNEVLAMLREESGLGDLCISRPKSRLQWGIAMPFDEKYVCYVWFDALINYLTGIGYPDGADFEGLWAESQHLVAKDILKPHAIFWPTMLHAIGVPPVKHLNVHGYWNVDDRKVSKSLGNMVEPLIMRDKYGFDAFRYYLLRDMPFGLDSNFSEEMLVSYVNADLANNLGNLVSRTLNMTARFAGGRVPSPGATGEPEDRIRALVAEAPGAVDARIRRTDIRGALELILGLVREANGYLETRQPWKAAKDPARKAEVDTTLHTCCEVLRIAALLFAPFIPRAAAEILTRLGLEGALERARLPRDAAWKAVDIVGLETTKGAPLFPRIELAAASPDPS